MDDSKLTVFPGTRMSNSRCGIQFNIAPSRVAILVLMQFSDCTAAWYFELRDLKDSLPWDRHERSAKVCNYVHFEKENCNLNSLTCILNIRITFNDLYKYRAMWIWIYDELLTTYINRKNVVILLALYLEENKRKQDCRWPTNFRRYSQSVIRYIKKITYG